MVPSKKTSIPVNLLLPVYLILMICLPVIFSATPFIFAETTHFKFLSLAIAPIIYVFSMVFIPAILSRPFHAAIIPGKFPRDVSHFIYGPRRMYGLCWGAAFYFTPTYYVFMSVPFLRTLILKAFGYKGHTDVNIAPDAWLRDLPVLNFSQGIYVANKATIGSNMCLSNGFIIVDKIILKPKALIGHLAMIAPGCRVGEGSEVGVGGGIGIRVRIGNNVKVGPKTVLNHGADIEDDVEVGTMSFIGVKARIAKGLKLPGGANIPDGAYLETPADIKKYLSSETSTLQDENEKLEAIFMSRIDVNNSNPPTPLHRASGE